ncbi:MAG: glycoside hydrolase family 2, partial [Proteobacteria bacterium]|nr:glycoside hydrolase family 2 [Pseudomonadota bacterium]
MAIIQATGAEGSITLKAESKGLETSHLELSAIKTDQPIEREVLQSNTNKPINTGLLDEIPVRKLELLSDSGRILSPENTDLTVNAHLFPIDTSYTDLEWSLVNDAGVEATNVSLTFNGNKAHVSAKGDGAFRVRCTSKNGTDKIKLISELDMEVTGMGTAYKNPYAL